MMARVGCIFNHADVVGGGELSFLDLVVGVRDLDIEPVAFVPAGGEIEARLGAEGVEVHVLPCPAIRLWRVGTFLRARSEFLAKFRELALDLVHANGARCMLYAGFAARRVGIPCVWHVRVLDRDRLLDRIRARYASAVIVNSHAVQQSLAACVGAGSRIEMIYNGFRISDYRDAKPLDLRNAFGVPPGPVVVCASRLIEEKGIHDLVEACAIVTGRGTDFSLVLTGDPVAAEPGYVAELKKVVDGHGLTNVLFVGWRDDVSSIMKSADAVVLASRQEAFGRVVVEAWACGVPLVATRAGGPGELVRDGVDGILADVGNPESLAAGLETILGDRALVTRLKENGISRAVEFSQEAHAARTVTLYRELLARSSS